MTTVIYNLGQNLYNLIMADKTIKEGQILEPLSCVIKLAMLHLKEEGTKLQIIDNSIKFDNPCVLQGPNRWLSGDNRSDLHNLSNPLHISIEWYNPENSTDLKYIYEQALHGLDTLGKSYKINEVSSLIANTIEHYRILINSSLKSITDDNNDTDSNNDINKEYKKHSKKLTESIISDNIDINKQYKELWNKMEINIIKKLLMIAVSKKEKGELYNNYLTSIESLLDDKDDKIRNIVHKNKTKI